MRAHLTSLLAATAVTALALPAAAQSYYVADGPYVDEVIVSPLDRNVSRLSQRVSFADLDLTTRAGQDVLRLRPSATPARRSAARCSTPSLTRRSTPTTTSPTPTPGTAASGPRREAPCLPRPEEDGGGGVQQSCMTEGALTGKRGSHP